MLTVILPVVVLFAIILLPVPKIGGDARIGCWRQLCWRFCSGGWNTAAATAVIGGIDRIAWVIGLSIFGSIYAQSQVRLGTMDTVLNIFRASLVVLPRAS